MKRGQGRSSSYRARELDQACFTAYIEGLRQAGYKPDARQVRLGFTLTLGLKYLLGNTVGETIPSLLDQERRERLFENVSIPDPENVKSNPDNVKSNPDNVAFYQGIVFELLRQLEPGFTLRLLARALGYMIRLRSKEEGEEHLPG